MEAKPRSWWALLSLALVGCSSVAEPSKSGEKAGENASNLQSPTKGGVDVNALAEQAAIAAAAPCPSCGISVTPNTGLRRILLLSIDGMHAADYYKYVANNPRSNIGKLYLHGIDYPNATTTTPSGGFPGMLAIATGASPKTTGVYDEDSYDRTLYPPGSNCIGAVGTEIVYDSSIAQDATQLFSPINKANLPLFKTAQGQCVEVYPHSFLKSPTIFQVIQGSGRRTAWNDNRASYEILSGPSGKGISELYAPDISSTLSTVSGSPNGVDLAGSAALCNSDNAYGIPPFSYTTCVPLAAAFDDTKVQAVINKIDGFAADGSRQSAVPTILGMSFAAVDVAQKLPAGGYLNNAGDPKPALTAALNRVDLSIGRILTELDTRHFIDKTLIVLTAKHAQSPIDPSKWRTRDTAASPLTPVASDPRLIVQGADVSVDVTKAPFVNPNTGLSPATTGHVQLADSGIVWLQNQNNVNVTNVVQALTNSTNVASMAATVRPQGSIFSTNIVTGTELIQAYGDPQSSTDLLAAARAPNAFVQPELGVIYKNSLGQIAEHGGGAQDDINVPLLISNTGIVNHVSLIQPVSTEQVALTILRALTLDGTKLTGASAEGTSALPGIVWGPGTYQGGSTVNAVDYTSQTSTTVTGTPPYVGNFNAGSSICFNDVYLTDVVSITVTYASANTATNSALSVRIDGPNGTKVGQVVVPSTGGWTTWKTISIPIAPAQTGLHQVCLRGETGTGIANLLNFSLVPVCVPECTNATCGSDGCGGVCGTCGFNFLCDDPFAQCIVPPTKYSVVNTALLSLIPAPAYDVQSGTTPGGTTTVQSFDANDYACYYGVELTNVQKIVATLASATAGGVLSFRIDSPTGTQIGSYTVPATGGATTFKSKQIPLALPTVGTHALCVRGETGSGIANLQSFQLSDQPVLPKYVVGNTIAASPPDSQQGTNNDPGGYISNFDTNDFVCYEEVDMTGVNSVVANVSSANGGGSFSARLGSPSGTRIATFRVPNTGSWTTFTDVGSNISTSSGMTTLCFVGESGSGIANLKSFTLSSLIIPSKYSLGGTSIIPATPPDTQQGTNNDPGGWISNFDANDYYCYDSVDLTGVNSIVASVASANSGGVFSVRAGSPSGVRIGQSIVLSTGSWTAFVSLNVAIAPTSGVTTLCITGDSGTGIGNIRSLTLSSATVAKNYSLGAVIPGAPPSSQTGITVNGTTITYFDVNDWFCYDGVDLTGVHTITTRAASGGSGNRFSVRIGSQTGFQIGSFTTTNTGGYNTYANWNVGISNSPGVQKLCFFGLQGTGIANIQSVTLSP